MKDIVEQITLVMFPDLFQTRTTNYVVFAAVENTSSKIVKNSSEVMSRRDGGRLAETAQTMFFMSTKTCSRKCEAKKRVDAQSLLHKKNIVMHSECD
jgi:hypothetical protein